ncbi:CDP-glycerol glycerophosphotransferase family protein [Flexivirga alba]|uniref:CDP-glycerol glycerophosphotransferase family protein n=1 Tax=Flexivirga alba TaxID=702742 RepID=A0ABW2ACZ5_9MICO
MDDVDKKQVIGLLRTVLESLDPHVIVDYRLTAIAPEARALMLTLGGSPLPAAGAVRVAKNVPGAFELSYLFQGEQPVEQLDSLGRTIKPLAVKTRQLDYFGQEDLKERIIRLPAIASVTLCLNGKPQLLRHVNYYFGSTHAHAKEAFGSAENRSTPIWRQVAIRGAEELVCWTKAPLRNAEIARRAATLRGSRYRAFIRNLAKTPHFHQKYDGAWLVMDRLRSAGDNGEYLYDYLDRERPDINAWFVLQKGGPEWDRLKSRGFRLIDFRSIEHLVALQCAAVVASSQLDVEMEQPVPKNFYRRSQRPWRFVYLQHGVLQHNLAHWFNGKDIDLLTTASVDEHESIVADGTTYKLTTDSVTLTGFPRYDAAARAGAKHPFGQRSIILVAPTWRNSLFLPKSAFGAQRRLKEPFLHTEYGRKWMGFLCHPDLEQFAAQSGAQVVYLPHPNLRGNAPEVSYPDHVQVIESTPDTIELMSRARVTVTDYSSIFFDAALAKSRVVFFQFDQDSFLNGGHTYLPGRWDYAQDGFGPVESSVDGAIAQTICAYSASASDWPGVYDERVARTIPLTDGSAAERITDEIEAKFLS